MELARLAPFYIINAVSHHGRPVTTHPLDSIMQFGPCLVRSAYS